MIKRGAQTPVWFARSLRAHLSKDSRAPQGHYFSLVRPMPTELQPNVGMRIETVINPRLLNGRRSDTSNAIKQSELPWQRAAAYHFAAGMSSKEVAEANDVSLVTIASLLRTPWFQELVTTLMAENGGNDIMAMFKAEQINSLQTVVEIRDNEKVPAVTRLAAARDILDRGLGKPLQRVEQSNSPTSGDPVAEVERLERENNRLRGETP